LLGSDELRWKLPVLNRYVYSLQDQFPVLVEARLSGVESLETSGLFEVEWSHNICKNGDIGKEFEAQLDEMRRENEDRARAEEDQVSILLSAF
jgi:hypothetical protein